ncbi:hypothetical protein ACC702_39770, partial [Rhizobium ruizarguesonis]
LESLQSDRVGFDEFPVKKAFAAPQNPVEMATMSSTPIASAYNQLRTGGDLAALKGLMKRIFERDDADIAAGGKGFLDR